MTKYRLLTAAAWGSLTGALLLAAMPAAAQERGFKRSARAEQRAENPGEVRAAPQRDSRPARAERPERPERSVSSSGGDRAAWQGRRDGASGMAGNRGAEMAAARAAARAQVPTDAGQAAARVDAAPSRNRSYGATTRRDWAAERQARETATQQQQQQQQQQARTSGSWARPGDRSNDGRRGEWGNRSSDSRRADWQRDRREDARRDERRDDARNYASGYRDGRRDDNRYSQNHRRWDNRGWRNDNRYDWYRYRASNRSLFSLGRYYAPYRGYSYSRINIGFRLGSLFYGNRYWINDPGRYRLPDVYGPYRWVRYYDDALLVDVYSGEVVDVIHNFFW